MFELFTTRIRTTYLFLKRNLPTLTNSWFRSHRRRRTENPTARRRRHNRQILRIFVIFKFLRQGPPMKRGAPFHRDQHDPRSMDECAPLGSSRSSCCARAAIPLDTSPTTKNEKNYPIKYQIVFYVASQSSHSRTEVPFLLLAQMF